MPSDEPAVRFGPAPRAQAPAAILLHGRGRDAADIVDTARRLALPDLACLALPAPRGSWYPERFMAPIEANQPQLDHALARIEQSVRELEEIGCERRRIALIGFSQGACLAAQYGLTHPTRWGALVVFTGGLLGPEETRWNTAGALDGTPVLLGAGETDPWVTWRRIEQTAEVFERMGATVRLQAYPGGEHIVRDEEIAAAREVLRSI